MSKYNVLIAVPCYSGSMRAEVSQWIREVSHQAVADPEVRRYIDHLYFWHKSYCPTPVCRNLIVEKAREKDVDVLVMVDDDMVPASGFFKTAFEFLRKAKGPAIIASPYCSGPIPHQEVQVFEFLSPINAISPDGRAAVLEHMEREKASHLKGIHDVANVGTGLWACTMSTFDKFRDHYGTDVYFDYSYDERHLAVTETEDTRFGRMAYWAGIPIAADFDHWSGHVKNMVIGKPEPILFEDLMQVHEQSTREMERRHKEEQDGRAA